MGHLQKLERKRQVPRAAGKTDSGREGKCQTRTGQGCGWGEAEESTFETAVLVE